MAKTAYKISLKGNVGGADFARTTVGRELSKNDGKQVNVLIDSLATDLSISVAFKNHGNVNVHFAGLNAYAVTITSLGAAHISIDAGTMCLAHKCSMAFFEWVSSTPTKSLRLLPTTRRLRLPMTSSILTVSNSMSNAVSARPKPCLPS